MVARVSRAVRRVRPGLLDPLARGLRLRSLDHFGNRLGLVGSETLLGCVEHLGTGITDDAGRARRAVAHRRFGLRDPLDADEAYHEKRPENCERYPAECVVRVSQVEDIVGLDLCCELSHVGAVHFETGAPLQVAVGDRENCDERDAADAPGLRCAKRERQGEWNPRQHDSRADRSADVHEGAGFCQLLRERVHVVLLHSDDAFDERRNSAHRLHALLEEVDAHEVERDDHKEADPVGEPVHGRCEDRGDHPHKGKCCRSRVEAEENPDHLHDSGNHPPECHHECRGTQDAESGSPREVREPVLVLLCDPQGQKAVKNERADDRHRSFAREGEIP